MVTLTYLLVGKALNVLLVCKSKLKVQNLTVTEDSDFWLTKCVLFSKNHVTDHSSDLSDTTDQSLYYFGM